MSDSTCTSNQGRLNRQMRRVMSSQVDASNNSALKRAALERIFAPRRDRRTGGPMMRARRPVMRSRRPRIRSGRRAGWMEDRGLVHDHPPRWCDCPRRFSRTRRRIAATCDGIAGFAGAFAPACDRIATSASSLTSGKIDDDASFDRTNRPRECATRQEGEHDVIGAFATPTRPNETTSRVCASTFESNGTTSSSIASVFLRAQSLACPMLLHPLRPARAGCGRFSRNQSSSPAPGCPASSGRCARRKV